MTLIEAIVLVILVVFIFLQNWRATLIPLLTVPVAVIGTFALFPLLGFSINITSMFGLVLAIGIVVDDAIVVVEAVQRHIDDGMPSARGNRARDVRSVCAGRRDRVHSGGGLHSGRFHRRHQRSRSISKFRHYCGLWLSSAFSVLSKSALASMLLRPINNLAACSLEVLGYSTAASIGMNRKYMSSVRVLRSGGRPSRSSHESHSHR